MGVRQRKGKMSEQAKQEPQKKTNGRLLPKKEIATMLKKRQELDGSLMPVVTVNYNYCLHNLKKNN